MLKCVHHFCKPVKSSKDLLKPKISFNHLKEIHRNVKMCPPFSNPLKSHKAHLRSPKVQNSYLPRVCCSRHQIQNCNSGWRVKAEPENHQNALILE